MDGTGDGQALDIRHGLADDDPPHGGGYPDPRPRMGFFTDTTVCIGCKACEVACKEWNACPRGRVELHRDVV